MRILIENIYNDSEKLYEGSDAIILRDLVFDFPWATEGKTDLRDVLHRIDSSQVYQVFQLQDKPLSKTEAFDKEAAVNSPIVRDMVGFNPEYHEAFKAAKFLSGNRELPPEIIRECIVEHEDDMEAAALKAYGLDDSEENRLALRAIMEIQQTRKGEQPFATADTITSELPEGQDVAEAITRAYKDEFVLPIALAGKHSHGTLLAYDNDSQKAWLLKPGSGNNSPALGVRDEKASQSRREAAFYAIAKTAGLHDMFQRAELIVIDGKEYAAIELLPWDFKTAEAWKKLDKTYVRQGLFPLLIDGTLHKCAALDFVLGNADSHGQNTMLDEKKVVKLIDHGSAFAGDGFSPATDKNTFVPYYLRFMLGNKFSSLTPEQKASSLPMVNAGVESMLKTWVLSLPEGAIEAICLRYGINPQPTINRLHKLQAMCQMMRADEAINQAWVIPDEVAKSEELEKT